MFKDKLGIFSQDYLSSSLKHEHAVRAGSAGKGSKKPGAGPKPHPIEVTTIEGEVFIFKSREEVCRVYALPPPTLAYYLRQSATLTKGKFKGFTFQFTEGWKRFKNKG